MRYTKPMIVRTEAAMAAIQQVDQTGGLKTPVNSFDSDPIRPQLCSPGAYEADE
jgi:hypothetical protein